MLQGFASYTGLSVAQLKLSGFLGNRESRRKGTGISVAEIRPYQPGDTIKQVDRISTAKKSELMTKLSHQEEHLAWMHCVAVQDLSLRSAVHEVVSAISFAGLKYGDTVGALLAGRLFPASRKQQALTAWYETIHTASGWAWSDESNWECLQQLSHSVIMLYTDDFPDEHHRSLLTQLAIKNTVMMVVVGHPEQFTPQSGNQYGYASTDLGGKNMEQYRAVLEDTIHDTRAFMHSINGKLLCIQSGGDVLTQLALQRTF